MAYSIHDLGDVLHVRYFGTVDALDLIRQAKDENYTQPMRALRRVIFDYSDVDVSEITIDDAREFGFLASLESNFTDSMKTIFVLSDDRGRQRVKAYTDALATPTWQVCITNQLDKAVSLLREESID